MSGFFHRYRSFLQKAFPQKSFLQRLSMPGLWSYERNPVWTNLPRGVYTNSNPVWLWFAFQHFPWENAFLSIKLLLRLNSLAEVFFIDKAFFTFLAQTLFTLSVFFHVWQDFPVRAGLLISELHLTVAAPLRMVWCIFRSLLYAPIASLS